MVTALRVTIDSFVFASIFCCCTISKVGFTISSFGDEFNYLKMVGLILK